MRKIPMVAAAGLTVALTALTIQPAMALDEVNTAKLRKAVTVSGILTHERALQRIANSNDGTRASGTPGFAASADYVVKQLKQSGYSVKRQEFTFPFFRDLADPTLSEVSPTPADYETATFTYSGSGDVTGTLVPIDLVLPPTADPSSTSGCEASDFPAAPAEPAVALIQRGTCTFEIKAQNAAAAGYEAAVIFNEGQPGRQELLVGTAGTPRSIPVLGLSFEDGNALAAQAANGTVTVHVTATTETDLNAKTWNVIADSPSGDTTETVVVGAHLDSVVAGPGINDNGSGTSTVLEIAKQIQALNLKPKRALRFAFWGAEEPGLLGSEYYVNNLSEAQISKIYANLNFDMLGSPNYVRFVYDGDGSDTPAAGPPGSDTIEALFNGYFADQGLATDPTAFDGRSDYGPFIAVGVPAGGLFSGAEGIKTPEQAAVYGGTAGEAYDSCYHQACDTITNLNAKALDELGDGAAHAVWTLAKSKTGVFPDGSRMSAAAAKSARKASGVAEGHVPVR